MAILSAIAVSSPAQGQAAPDASCDVTLEQQGYYFEGSGITEVAPQKFATRVLKGLFYASKFTLKGKNWYEGRGIFTFGWNVSLNLKSGNLPKGRPEPKNFTTSNNTGGGESDAKMVAKNYAHEAGCTNLNIVKKIAPEVAKGKFEIRISLLWELLRDSFADAEEESPELELISLKEANANFERSSKRVTQALRILSSDGCVTTARVTALAASAVEANEDSSRYVKQNLENLNTQIGTPMQVDGSAACAGSFSSVMRELESRRQAISGTRHSLSDAAAKQLQVMLALFDVKDYSVRDRACARQAFKGFRNSASGGLGSIGSFGQIDAALTASETEFTALIKKNNSLLASCGGGVNQSPTIVTGRAISPSSVVSSAAPARVPASDITGVKEDQAKQKSAP
jgi:hypothetical protein